MQTAKVFVHGVPDTPAVWTPLKAALGHIDVYAPALPGFTSPPPSDFVPTKENYTDWLIKELEQVHSASGPVDLVGHDWGALLTLRAASLRPDLIRTWAVSGAVIHPDYEGHKTAKRWATPLLGELIMKITTIGLLEKALVAEGLPPPIAKIEASNWNRPMRQCILSLYRSANGLRFEEDWLSGLEHLPANGLVLWGEHDPYVAADFGLSFAERRSVPFHKISNTGHWAIAEQADIIAKHLQTFWASV